MLTKKIVRPVAIMLATSLLCSGCVSPSLMRDTQQAAEQARQQGDDMAGALYARMRRDRAAIEREQEVDKPFLAGRTVPTARNVTLPLALRNNVDTYIVFPERSMPLAVAAQRMTMATGIPVKIEQDVYLPRSLLLPKSLVSTNVQGVAAGPAGNASAARGAFSLGATPAPGVPLPSDLAGASASALGGTSASPSIPLLDDPLNVEFKQSEKMSLASMLDLISTRLSINWEYSPSRGVIRFYRLVTKSWSLPFRGKDAYTAQFLASSQAMSSSSANSTGQVSLADGSTKSDNKDSAEMEGIRDSIAPVMTRAGSVSLNPVSGLLTLSDTKEAVDRADGIIRPQIADAARMVYFKFQAIDFTLTDSGEAGVDWNAALTKALQHVPGFSFGAVSPASILSQGDGQFSLGITSGGWSGTQAIVNALKQYGTVTSSTTIPFALRNRHAAEYNDLRSFVYVSSTTAATATAGGTGGTPGLTTTTDTVGFRMRVYTDATTKDDVNVTLGFEQSQLDGPIGTFSSGSGSTQQSVQVPKKIRRYMPQQEFPIRNGQTIIVTSLDQTGTQMTHRTLAEHLPLLAGGSLLASKSRTFTLVLATVMVQDQGAAP
ncbi:protein PilN [Ralstonia nicotianae]|uniref:protein PilN n=1 Tax=Ralstonia pseudosolanacearum TaxID=1310165 RepID=UPI00200345A7|nr:protein PilN [Ralstonia pseudosolanacearum]MCK4118398.1 protein PilN [Ralstonia pseudosolanacearum]